jgi:hypothetical protein
VTLEGLVRLRMQVRSCSNPECPRCQACLRPEAEGRFALPRQEFGLDVIALSGRLRHAERRSVPEIHAELVRRGVPICERSVGNLVDRDDELLALACADPARLRAAVASLGRAILAIDGLQPDVGHEVLWVVREVLSGEVLLARSLRSSTQDDLAALIAEVEVALGDPPIAGVVSDGQTSIRRAVAKALPGVPHQLCHFLTRAILANTAGRDAAGVRRRFDGLPASLRRHGRFQGVLAAAFAHFGKATRSYRPHRFACYDVAGLPRTNNDLVQLFGSYRYHERRCSGRRGKSPARGRWSAARSACLPRRRRERGPSSRPTWPPRTWPPGVPCGPLWNAVETRARSAAASAATPTPTSDPLLTP